MKVLRRSVVFKRLLKGMSSKAVSIFFIMLSVGGDVQLTLESVQTHFSMLWGFWFNFVIKNIS
jgi:hypothetical protein